MKINDLVVFGDFELVINHIRKIYNIKKEKLKLYARRIWDIIESFNSFNRIFVP